MACVTALSACGRLRMTMPAVPRRSNRISADGFKRPHAAPAGTRATPRRSASAPFRIGTLSSEHPRVRIRYRPALVERQHAFDAAYQRPDEPPGEHSKTDDNEHQDPSDGQVSEPDPEGPNLKAVVC